MKRNIIWWTVIMLNFANCNCGHLYDVSDLKTWYDNIKRIYEQPYTVELMDFKRLDDLTCEELAIPRIEESIRRIKNFSMYYMLLYMHARRLENYAVNTAVEKSCPTLAEQIVVTRINTDHFKRLEFSRYAWIFLMHTQKMKQLASMPDNENRNAQMEKLNDNGLKYVLGEMAWECNIDSYYSSTNKHKIFKNVLSLDHSSALNKLTGLCERQKIREDQIKEVHFDRLCLNNVIENEVIMDTLTTGFGGLKNSDQIVDVLSTLMESVKNPTTSLYVMINSLKSVHQHFIQMLKTIMLQVFQTFVNHLLSLKKLSRSKNNVHQFHCELTNFAKFLGLRPWDDFVKLVSQLIKWETSLSFYTFHKSTKLKIIRDNIDRLLETYELYDYTMGNEKINSLENIDSKSPEPIDTGNNEEDETDATETIENVEKNENEFQNATSTKSTKATETLENIDSKSPEPNDTGNNDGDETDATETIENVEKNENEIQNATSTKSTKATETAVHSETDVLVAIKSDTNLVNYLKQVLHGVSFLVIQNFITETFPEHLRCFL